jgi:hypothetical protein
MGGFFCQPANVAATRLVGDLYGYGDSPDGAIRYLSNFHRQELGFIVHVKQKER